jgi:FkbM family methyltransferase
MKHWEVEALAFVRDNLHPGDRFVDIGAWVGPYSLLASRLVEPSGRVYAIEPDPVARAALKRNMSENDAFNITVVPWAITEQKGMVDLIPYVLGDSRTKVRPGQEGQQVASVSLDEFCDTESLVPSVIKIDVEGAEPRVLDGGRRALQRARAVIVEVHQREILESGMDPSQFWRQLFDLGKRAFLLDAIDGTAAGTELSPELMVPGNVHILLH